MVAIQPSTNISSTMRVSRVATVPLPLSIVWTEEIRENEGKAGGGPLGTATVGAASPLEADNREPRDGLVKKGVERRGLASCLPRHRLEKIGGQELLKMGRVSDIDLLPQGVAFGRVRGPRGRGANIAPPARLCHIRGMRGMVLCKPYDSRAAPRWQ